MRSRFTIQPRFIAAALAAVLCAALSCSDDEPSTAVESLDPVVAMTPDEEAVAPLTPSVPPAGALLRVGLASTVGVLLDEMPASIRERVAGELLSRGDDFWVARAHRQIVLSTYRLDFRNFFYELGRPTTTARIKASARAGATSTTPASSASGWS